MEEINNQLEQQLLDAHRFAYHNGKMLKQTQICGCFYCQKIFSSSELQVEDFIPEQDGEETVWCPYCGIDSVIGEQSGYALTPEFLARMNQYWFYSKD
ncbi:hypothetical protein [Neisseria zalophi]|nr:hypothetical protein [Neisseria zalophi]